MLSSNIDTWWCRSVDAAQFDLSLRGTRLIHVQEYPESVHRHASQKQGVSHMWKQKETGVHDMWDRNDGAVINSWYLCCTCYSWTTGRQPRRNGPPVPSLCSWNTFLTTGLHTVEDQWKSCIDSTICLYIWAHNQDMIVTMPRVAKMYSIISEPKVEGMSLWFEQAPQDPPPTCEFNTASDCFNT